LGFSANIYLRDVVLQWEVGVFFFQHFQNLRSECRFINHHDLKVRPVKKARISLSSFTARWCVWHLAFVCLASLGVSWETEREENTQRQNAEREEGAGTAMFCNQKFSLDQCIGFDDPGGPRKHGKHQRSKDSDVCLRIPGPKCQLQAPDQESWSGGTHEVRLQGCKVM
jgi:hypothetical protein